MKIFCAVTHDTGDGMEPQVYTSTTLAGIKETALDVLEYRDPTVREYDCESCGSVTVEHPDGDWTEPVICSDCHLEMGWIDEDEELEESKEAVRAWDGVEELTVYYFDGNPGKMTLTTSEVGT